MSASEPAWDPLGTRIPLPLSATVFPLGYRLEIRTNAQAVIDAAIESWPGADLDHGKPPLKLAAIVAARSRARDQAAAEGFGNRLLTRAARYRAHGDVLVAAIDADNVVTSRLSVGELTLWVQADVVEQPPLFRKQLLEGVVYQTLCSLYLTPIHAACVSLNGRGVLICGPPGSGKSSLAYACAKAGFTFVSDDVTYLIRDETPNVLGRCHWIRMKPGAQQLFDIKELAELDEEGVAELRTDTELGFECSPAGVVAALVFLDPEAQASAPTKVSPANILSRLMIDLPADTPDASDSQIASLRQISPKNCWSVPRRPTRELVETVRMYLS